MSIFQPSVLKNFPQNENLIAKRWASYQEYLSKLDFVKSVKEEKYQDGFLKDIFENCLGYTLDSSNPSSFNLEREKKNETDGKKADGVIILNSEVIGVIELKDQKTKNLDSIEAQAFNYHLSHSKSKYIIISNFNELRFYIDKKTAYEKFSLFSLSYDEFKKLHLLLSFESIREDIPLRLKEKSANFEAEISKQLYRDFSSFRTHLFENIVHNNYEHEDVIPAKAGIQSMDLKHEDDGLLDKSTLLRLTQKLCDRIIFILFAEDRELLKHNTIKEIRDEFKHQKFTSYQLYDIYKFYFDAINNGNDKLGIPKYNGGLFAKDELLDSLIIDDSYLDMEAQKLSDYDFESDISVNILGHIFEQSLTDLEELNASIENSDFDKKKSKRKKDGVFYTPEYITRYIVQNTLGKLCDDKKTELNLQNVQNPANPKKLTKEENQTLVNIYAYREYLLNLKILDPACGSGAFLNQALEFLIREHNDLDELRRAYENELLSLYDIETNILEHNLYGVDINEDAVEIARLSLWLRTAKRGKSLTNLSNKIVCANSLLAMPFEENSFDVVIGNPPYVRQEAIKEQKEALGKIYKVANGTADLYVYFYELAIRLLKPNGLKGFICSNKFFRAKYGENLREYILENTTIQQIADFNGVKVFEDATVDSAITIFKKQIPNKNTSFKVVDIDLINSSTMKQSDLSKSSFTFSNPAELIIKQKIEKVGTLLKEWDININYGIKTGFNEAFIIDRVKKDELIKTDPKSAEIIKPLLRGRDIRKYDYEFADKWLINSHNNPPIDINDYPAIKEHLDQFYPQLEKRTDKGATPYNLRSCAYLEKFEQDKIIYPETTVRRSEFVFDNKNMFLDKTCFFIDGDNLKYLNSLLNSKLLQYFLEDRLRVIGKTTIQYSKQYIIELPIPQISLAEQQPFIVLVDEILEAKEKIKKYKKHFDTLNAVDKIEITEEIEKLGSLVQSHENTIDKMVYELYGLSDDEIGIVDGV